MTTRVPLNDNWVIQHRQTNEYIHYDVVANHYILIKDVKGAAVFTRENAVSFMQSVLQGSDTYIVLQTYPFNPARYKRIIEYEQEMQKAGSGRVRDDRTLSDRVENNKQRGRKRRKLDKQTEIYTL